jgi:phage shock protein PspC (stress-responsive transcriptional regulator)
MAKRLYRSRHNRVILGVCGGLAEYFDIDPTIVRVIAVLSVFVTGLGILAYFILALVLPVEGAGSAEPKDTVRENVEDMKVTAGELGRELRATLEGEEAESDDLAKTRRNRRYALGIILILLGVIFLLASLGIWWFRWGVLWPLVLVAIGVLIIIGVSRSRR